MLREKINRNEAEDAKYTIDTGRILTAKNRRAQRTLKMLRRILTAKKRRAQRTLKMLGEKINRKEKKGAKNTKDAGRKN